MTIEELKKEHPDLATEFEQQIIQQEKDKAYERSAILTGLKVIVSRFVEKGTVMVSDKDFPEK